MEIYQPKKEPSNRILHIKKVEFEFKFFKFKQLIAVNVYLINYKNKERNMGHLLGMLKSTQKELSSQVHLVLLITAYINSRKLKIIYKNT